MPRFDPNKYVTVQDRIVLFWEQYPEGAIRTQLESPSDDFDTCRYSASIFKDRNNNQPDAVGWAFEKAGGNGANSTSHEENCETSAIGRALANMGYAVSQETRPSREEMQKVNRQLEADDAEKRGKVNKALHAKVKHAQLHAWAQKQNLGSLTDAPLDLLMNLDKHLRDPEQLKVFNTKFPVEVAS